MSLLLKLSQSPATIHDLRTSVRVDPATADEIVSNDVNPPNGTPILAFHGHLTMLS